MNPKVKIGDYIIFTDSKYRYFTNGKEYKVVEYSPYGNPGVIDDNRKYTTISMSLFKISPRTQFEKEMKEILNEVN